MRLKCRSCNGEIDKENVKKKKSKSGRGGFIATCPFCGAINNIKCRHRNGNVRSIKLGSFKEIPI